MKIRALLAAALAALSLSFSAGAVAPAKPDLIEVIEIRGVIDQATATAVAAQVEKINDTAKVKGVLLVVDSPGGGASASAVLYQELAKIKVPVVGYCEYMCASGGVYALMSPSVKYIAVRDDSIGGSVGVIMQLTRFNRLLDWAKVDNQTFKSGQFKDSGSPVREPSADDTKYLQSIVDGLASKFYGVVKKARPKADMKELALAKIYIGEDIVKVGLADSVMSKDQAVAKLKEIAGAKNAYTRDELRKITKDASETANMAAPAQPNYLDRGMKHLDTAMDIVADVRRGESIRFQYLMPYRFD